MPRDTKFNATWLDQTDDHGIHLKRWLKQGETEKSFKCLLCKTSDLDCANRGWNAVYQHMKTAKHEKVLKAMKQNLKFFVEASTSQTPSSSGDVSENTQVRLEVISKPMMLNLDDQIVRAETLWALTVARRGFSYNSYDELGDVFRCMFPDSKIAQGFSIQSKKLSYVLSHGIGPFFHRELIKDLKRTDKLVLCFDEQTNVQNRKQLDIYVKFWCYDKGLAVTRFYKSLLLGHAPACVIQNALLDIFKTDGIDLKKLFMIGRDNPNVNISVENLIDKQLKKLGSGLLMIGSCNLHVVHNGFKNGMPYTCL